MKGKREGNGKQTITKGTAQIAEYNGNWKDNNMNGYGEMQLVTTAGKERFKGNFNNGEPENGELTKENGDLHSGYFASNFSLIKGVITSKDGIVRSVPIQVPAQQAETTDTIKVLILTKPITQLRIENNLTDKTYTLKNNTDIYIKGSGNDRVMPVNFPIGISLVLTGNIYDIGDVMMYEFKKDNTRGYVVIPQTEVDALNTIPIPTPISTRATIETQQTQKIQEIKTFLAKNIPGISIQQNNDKIEFLNAKNEPVIIYTGDISKSIEIHGDTLTLRGFIGDNREYLLNSQKSILKLNEKQFPVINGSYESTTLANVQGKIKIIQQAFGNDTWGCFIGTDFLLKVRDGKLYSKDLKFPFGEEIYNRETQMWEKIVGTTNSMVGNNPIGKPPTHQKFHVDPNVGLSNPAGEPSIMGAPAIALSPIGVGNMHVTPQSANAYGNGSYSGPLPGSPNVHVNVNASGGGSACAGLSCVVQKK